MFKALYEIIANHNDDPVYETQVFATVGQFTFLLTAILALIFYLLLGRWKPVWEKIGHWLVTIVAIALAAAFFAIQQAKIGTEEDDIDSYMYSFAFANALYAVVFFFILSLLLKRFSIFAKRTPF
jgi:hypothetical protein